MRHDVRHGEASGPRDLSAALDEVERQLRSMPGSEVLGHEDLEWSIGTIFVDAQVRSTDPLVIDLEASQGVLGRSSEKLIVRLDPE